MENPSSRKIQTCILSIPLGGPWWHQYVFYGDERIINSPDWLSAKVEENNGSCSFQIYPNIIQRKGLKHFFEQQWKITTKYEECDDSWYNFGFKNCKDEIIVYFNDNSFSSSSI